MNNIKFMFSIIRSNKQQISIAPSSKSGIQFYYGVFMYINIRVIKFTFKFRYFSFGANYGGQLEIY